MDATATDMTKVFYFGADASAFGGIFTAPSGLGPIPSAGSVSLSQAGGTVCADHTPPASQGISVGRACSTVTGDQVLWPVSGWQTVVTSEIENLDILGIVKANKLTCEITVVHPSDDPPYYPYVSFAKCNYGDGLTINGETVVPVLDTTPYDRSATNVADVQCSWLDDICRLSKVETQTTALLNSDGAPAWLNTRYGWMKKANSRRAKGHVLCSLVTGFNSDTGMRSFGHVLEVPNLGYLFFGELMVSHGSFGVTMLRAELLPECTKNSDARKSKPPLGGTMVFADGHTKGIPSP